MTRSAVLAAATTLPPSPAQARDATGHRSGTARMKIEQPGEPRELVVLSEKERQSGARSE
jgi:hypothetical protein